MYDILELNKKLLGDLRTIAKELDVKKIESFKKQDLIYKILDEQAIQATADKKSTKKEKPNDRPHKPRPRAERIKEAGDEKQTSVSSISSKIEEAAGELAVESIKAPEVTDVKVEEVNDVKAEPVGEAKPRDNRPPRKEFRNKIRDRVVVKDETVEETSDEAARNNFV